MASMPDGIISDFSDANTSDVSELSKSIKTSVESYFLSLSCPSWILFMSLEALTTWPLLIFASQ